MRFQNHVVLVTGSTRGIGRKIAYAFAREGAHEMIIGRNAQLAQQTAQEFIQSGFTAESYPCDVTNLENVQEIVNKILDKHKRIDI